MSLIASGKEVGQIAQELSLGVKTVNRYRARILEKMNMETNAELTHYAIQKELVQPLCLGAAPSSVPGWSPRSLTEQELAMMCHASYDQICRVPPSPIENAAEHVYNERGENRCLN